MPLTTQLMLVTSQTSYLNDYFSSCEQLPEGDSLDIYCTTAISFLQSLEKSRNHEERQLFGSPEQARTEVSKFPLKSPAVQQDNCSTSTMLRSTFFALQFQEDVRVVDEMTLVLEIWRSANNKTLLVERNQEKRQPLSSLFGFSQDLTELSKLVSEYLNLLCSRGSDRNAKNLVLRRLALRAEQMLKPLEGLIPFDTRQALKTLNDLPTECLTEEATEEALEAFSVSSHLATSVLGFDNWDHRLSTLQDGIKAISSETLRKVMLEKLESLRPHVGNKKDLDELEATVAKYRQKAKEVLMLSTLGSSEDVMIQKVDAYFADSNAAALRALEQPSDTYLSLLCLKPLLNQLKALATEADCTADLNMNLWTVPTLSGSLSSKPLEILTDLNVPELGIGSLRLPLHPRIRAELGARDVTEAITRLQEDIKGHPSSLILETPFREVEANAAASVRAISGCWAKDKGEDRKATLSYIDKTLSGALSIRNQLQKKSTDWELLILGISTLRLVILAVTNYWAVSDIPFITTWLTFSGAYGSCSTFLESPQTKHTPALLELTRHGIELLSMLERLSGKKQCLRWSVLDGLATRVHIILWKLSNEFPAIGSTEHAPTKRLNLEVLASFKFDSNRLVSMEPILEYSPEEFIWMLCAGWLDRTGVKVVNGLQSPLAMALSTSVKAIASQLCEGKFAIDRNLRNTALNQWQELVKISGTIRTYATWGEFQFDLVSEPDKALEILYSISLDSHHLMCLASSKDNRALGNSRLLGEIHQCLLTICRAQVVHAFLGKWPERHCTVTDARLPFRLELVQELQGQILLEYSFKLRFRAIYKLIMELRFGLPASILITREWVKMTSVMTKRSAFDAGQLTDLLSSSILSGEMINSLRNCDEEYRTTLLEEGDIAFRKAATSAKKKIEELEREYKKAIDALCVEQGVTPRHQAIGDEILALSREIFAYATAPHIYENNWDETLQNLMISGFTLASSLDEDAIAHAESFTSKQWRDGKLQSFVSIFSLHKAVNVILANGSEKKTCGLGYGEVLIELAPHELYVNHSLFHPAHHQTRKRAFYTDETGCSFIFFFSLTLPKSSRLGKAIDKAFEYASDFLSLGGNMKLMDNLSLIRNKMEEYSQRAADIILSVGFNYFGAFKMALNNFNLLFEEQKNHLRKMLHLLERGLSLDTSVAAEALYTFLTEEEAEKICLSINQIQGLENGTYRILPPNTSPLAFPIGEMDFPIDSLSQLAIPEGAKQILDKWALENAGEFSIRTLDVRVEESNDGTPILSCRQKGTKLNFCSLMANSPPKTIKLYVYNRTNRILTCWIDGLPEKSYVKASPKNWEIPANSSHDVTIAVDTFLARKRNRLYKKFAIGVTSADLAKISVPIVVEAEIVFPLLSIKPGKLVDFGSFCSLRESEKAPELHLTSTPDKDMLPEHLQRELVLQNDCKLELSLDIHVEQSGNYFSVSTVKAVLPPESSSSLFVSLNKGTPKGSWEGRIVITVHKESFEVQVRATVKAAALQIDSFVDLGSLPSGRPATKRLSILNCGDWPARVNLKPITHTNWQYSCELATYPAGTYVIPGQSTKCIPLRVTTSRGFSEPLIFKSDAVMPSVTIKCSTDSIRIQANDRERRQFNFANPEETPEAHFCGFVYQNSPDIKLISTCYDGFRAEYTGPLKSFSYRITCQATSMLVGRLELSGLFRVESSVSCEPLYIPFRINTTQPVMTFPDWKPILLETYPGQETHKVTIYNSGNSDLHLCLSVNESARNEHKIKANSSKQLDIPLLDRDELSLAFETNEWSWDETTGKIITSKKSTYSVPVLRITHNPENDRVAFPFLFTTNTAVSPTDLIEEIMAACSCKKNVELTAAVLAWYCAVPCQDLLQALSKSENKTLQKVRASNWNQKFLIDRASLDSLVIQQVMSSKNPKEGVVALEDMMYLVGCSSFAVRLARTIRGLQQNCSPSDVKQALLKLGGLKESKLEFLANLLSENRKPALSSLIYYVDELCKISEEKKPALAQLSHILDTNRSIREKVHPALEVLRDLGFLISDSHIALASVWNAVLDGTLTSVQLLKRALNCNLITVKNPKISQKDFNSSALALAEQNGNFVDQMTVIRGLSEADLPDFNVDHYFEIIVHFTKGSPKLLELARIVQEKHKAWKDRSSKHNNCKFAAALVLFCQEFNKHRNFELAELCKMLFSENPEGGEEPILKFFGLPLRARAKDWESVREKYPNDNNFELFLRAYSFANSGERLHSLDHFLRALAPEVRWVPFVDKANGSLEELSSSLAPLLYIQNVHKITKISKGLVRSGPVKDDTCIKLLTEFYESKSGYLLCQPVDKEKLSKSLALKIQKHDNMQQCIEDLRCFGEVDAEVLAILEQLPNIPIERWSEPKGHTRMLKALFPLLANGVQEPGLLPLAIASFGITSQSRDDYRLPFVALMLAYSATTFESTECPICAEKEARQSHYCSKCDTTICSSCFKDPKLQDCPTCKIPLSPVKVYNFGTLAQPSPPPSRDANPNETEILCVDFSSEQPHEMAELYEPNQYQPQEPQFPTNISKFEPVDLIKGLHDDSSYESSDDELIEEEFICDEEITKQVKAERTSLNEELKKQFRALSKLLDELMAPLVGKGRIAKELIHLRSASVLTRAPQLLTELQDILEKHIFRVIFLGKQIEDNGAPSVLFSDWMQVVFNFAMLVQVAHENSGINGLSKIRLIFGIGDAIELIERLRSMFKRLNIAALNHSWLSGALLNLKLLHAVQLKPNIPEEKKSTSFKEIRIQSVEPSKPRSSAFVSAIANRQEAQRKQAPQRQLASLRSKSLAAPSSSTPGPSSAALSRASRSNAQIVSNILNSHHAPVNHAYQQRGTSNLSPAIPKYYNPPSDHHAVNTRPQPTLAKGTKTLKMKITGDKLREILSKMESASDVSYSALELSQVTAGDKQAREEHANARNYLYVSMREKLRPAIETNTATLVKSLDELRVDSREHVLNILFLLDNSGSMNFKDRILRMKAGLVVMLEVCNNLGIHTAAYAIGKADDHYPLKHFDEPMNIKRGEFILSGLTANSGSMIADGVQCAFTHIISKRREQLSEECKLTASSHIMTILLTDGISGQLKERPGAMEMSAFQQTSVEYKRAGIPLTMVQIVDQKEEVVSLSKEIGAKSTLEDLNQVCSDCGIVDWLKTALSGKRDPTRRFFWPDTLKLAATETEQNSDIATTEVGQEECDRFKKEAKDWSLHEDFATVLVSGMTDDKILKSLAKLPAIESAPQGTDFTRWVPWTREKTPHFYLSQLSQICNDSEEFLLSVSPNDSSTAQVLWNQTVKNLQSEISHTTARFAEMLPGLPSRKLVGNFDSGEEVNTMQFMELYWQNFPSLNYWLRRNTKTGEPHQRIAIVTCGADPELIVLVVEALKLLKLEWISVISADRRKPCLIKPPTHQAFDGNVIHLCRKLANISSCSSMNTQGGLPDAIHFAASLLLNGPGSAIKQRPVLLTLGASGMPLLSPGCSEAISQAHELGIQCMRIDVGRNAILGKALVKKNKDFPLFTVAGSVQLLPRALQECLAREKCTFKPDDLRLPPAPTVLVNKELKELQNSLPPAFKFDEPEYEIEVSQRAAAARASTFSAEFDVTFVIDKTGSMSSYIEACKNWSIQTANTIREKMKENNVDVSLRMAVVFYSGYCCNDGDPPCKVVGFGTPEEISLLTRGEKTKGGCGLSADVWSGLRKAVDLRWRDKAQKMIFLIGDEPGHNQPGLWVNDNNTETKNIGPRNPCGKTIIADMIKKGIQFTGPSITPHTDTMNKKFSSLFDGPGRQYHVKSLSAKYNPQEFTELVYDLVQSQLHNYVL